MDQPRRPTPTWREAFGVWCRVAALSFGGPTAQIAVMHRIVVDEKRWVSEQRFLHALNFCMLLPGPEAQQLATYLGWLLHGRRGGLLAGTLFVLPGVVVLGVLCALYVTLQGTTPFLALFFGLKAAVTAIVAEAVVRISRRVLKNHAMWLIAAAAFAGIFFLQLPFPMIILAAGIIGAIGSKVAPETFIVVKPKDAQADDEDEVQLRELPRPTLLKTLGVAAVFLTLWFTPTLACRQLLGERHVLTQEGWFFSQAASVTFGGAYAVLPFVQQQAVERHHWLEPEEMVDGLAMAETTPGPLIIVVQFVGFLAAYRDPAPFTPATAGVLGSLLTAWGTFVPSFMWVFVGAPYMERMRQARVLSGTLSAITAAVVGVVLNLAVWFALQTFFCGQVETVRWSALAIPAPLWSEFSPAAALLAALSGYLLIGRKWSMFAVLGLAVAVGAATVYFGG